LRLTEAGLGCTAGVGVGLCDSTVKPPLIASQVAKLLNAKDMRNIKFVELNDLDRRQVLGVDVDIPAEELWK